MPSSSIQGEIIHPEYPDISYPQFGYRITDPEVTEREWKLQEWKRWLAKRVELLTTKFGIVYVHLLNPQFACNEFGSGLPRSVTFEAPHTHKAVINCSAAQREKYTVAIGEIVDFCAMARVLQADVLEEHELDYEINETNAFHRQLVDFLPNYKQVLLEKNVDGKDVANVDWDTLRKKQDEIFDELRQIFGADFIKFLSLVKSQFTDLTVESRVENPNNTGLTFCSLAENVHHFGYPFLADLHMEELADQFDSDEYYDNEPDFSFVPTESLCRKVMENSS